MTVYTVTLATPDDGYSIQGIYACRFKAQQEAQRMQEIDGDPGYYDYLVFEFEVIE